MNRNTLIGYVAALAALCVALVLLRSTGWPVCAVALAAAAMIFRLFVLWRRSFPSYHRTWMELFDDVLSGGIRVQLRNYLVLILFVFLAFVLLVWLAGRGLEIVRAGMPTEEPEAGGFGAVFRGVLYYFLDPGNLFMERDAFVRVVTPLISLVGMFLLGGLLITTLSNSVERRVDQVERGQVVYPHIRDHYAIVGFGEITICLIRSLFRQHGWSEQCSDAAHCRTLPRIVVLTSQQIAAVRAALSSQLPRELDRKVILYAGNIESAEHIARLNIPRVREVYILGENDEYGRDTKNLECVRTVRRLRGDGLRMLRVHVQFDRPSSYSIVKKIALPEEYILDGQGRCAIYFRPFNFFENWARLLWGFYKDGHYADLDFEPLDGRGPARYVHLVIVGFNRMGRALLLEALRICHYPNYDERTGAHATRITVVDRNMDALLPRFRAEYPFLHQIADVAVDYVAASVEDEQVRGTLHAAATDPEQLLTVAVCLRDPDRSLSTGLSLPESVFYTFAPDADGRVGARSNDCRVLIRQELQTGREQEGLGAVLNGDRGKYRNVRIFGMLTDGISDRLVGDGAAMWVNAFYDLKYRPRKQPAKLPVYGAYLKYLARAATFEPGVRLPHVPYCSVRGRWRLLTEASLLNLATMPAHREAMKRFALELWCLTSEDLRFANRYQVEMYGIYARYAGHPALRNMEHRRWCADRSIIGYRNTGPEIAPDIETFKHHNRIVPFCDLPQSERQKDDDVIGNMHRIVRLPAPDSSAAEPEPAAAASA